jgi:hypothetical protein
VKALLQENLIQQLAHVLRIAELQAFFVVLDGLDDSIEFRLKLFLVRMPTGSPPLCVLSEGAKLEVAREGVRVGLGGCGFLPERLEETGDFLAGAE